MKYLISLLITISLWSCQKKAHIDELTGDLYFGFFRIGSYYNQPDSVIQFYESYFDTTNFKLRTKNEQQLYSDYQNLRRHNLLYSPFVQLLIEEDSVIRLYLDVNDYDKIKIHKRKKLQDQDKKVRIRSEVNRIAPGIYQCIELKDIDVIEGQTLQKQRKFKIEDYN